MRTRGLLALIFVSVCMIATAVPFAAAATAPPLLIAHRGGAALWPENTLAAFQNADAMFDGAGVPGWIELDTQFTKDRVLVVIHDATLDRTTNCSGAVVDRTLAQLAPCDAADAFAGWPAFEPIPTLREVFDKGKSQPENWRLVVEIKDIPGKPGFDVDCTELASALVQTARRSAFPSSRLVVQSFWPPCLDAVRSQAPAITTMLLTSSTTASEILGLPIPIGFTLAENALFATLRGYEISAPDHTAPDMNALTVSVAHLLGRRVIVWTPNTVRRMRELERMGVDGIISDRPDRLITALT